MHEEIEEERDSPSNFFGNLPHEMLTHVLSFLSFEEIDKFRTVNSHFKLAGEYLLGNGYRRVKQEVAICNERIGLRLPQCLKHSFYLAECDDYVTRILWFLVCTFLTNHFCLFDRLEGYLDKEYSVTGKSLDVANRILQFKDMKDPLLYVVEMAIGRDARHSNLKSYDDYGIANIKWFTAKKYRGQHVTFLYVPVFNKRQPGLNLPTCYATTKKEIYAWIVEMLSTLWMEEGNLERHTVYLPERDYDHMFVAELAPILNPFITEDPQCCYDSDTEDPQSPDSSISSGSHIDENSDMEQ